MTTSQMPPVWEESLSALMDGEASELEMQRLLAMADGDAAMRARWSRYQLAAALIRQQHIDAVASLDMADRIRTQLAQQPLAAVPVRFRSWGRSFAGLAVAASVAVAVVAGVQWQQRLFLQSTAQLAAAQPTTADVAPSPVGRPALNASPAAMTVVAATPGQRALQKSAAINAEQERYMRYHLERVSLDPNRGMVPMAATAVERER